MAQVHKELLLHDLCARLPYGVKVKITSRESKNRIVHLTVDNICHLTNGWWSECKPYLFPMTSMTEEQKEELLEITDAIKIDDIGIYYEEGDTLETYLSEIPYTFMCNVVTWCYKNHLDINNLIPLGLAKDATGLNIY